MTEPAVLSTEQSDGGSSSDDKGKLVSWLSRHNTILTAAAACVLPILYLLFVDHYAINVLQFDDWSTVTLVNSAVHGHLSLGQIWDQYYESRVPLVRAIFVFFGRIGRLDTRSVVFFCAFVAIAAYGVVLALFRRYLGRRLTPIPVLVIGLIWFSLADVQLALFAWQLSLYLPVFFFVVMVFAFIAPSTSRWLWFAVAVVAALAGSLSFFQGVILWPLGAICILWCQPWARRARIEIAVWIGAALVTVAPYLWGYNFNNNGCQAAISVRCSSVVGLQHPVRAFRYFIILIGNVIPGGYLGAPLRSFDSFELVGLVVFVTAAFIVIQSWRYRASRERIPLPLLFIVFSLLVDGTIALGRSGLSYADAVNNNRYIISNLVLLTGIVMYGWAHMPPFRLRADDHRSQARWTWCALVALAILVIVQVVVATGFGLDNARKDREMLSNQARLAVNLDRVPAEDRACEIHVVLWDDVGVPPWFSKSTIRTAAADKLGQFQSSSYRFYRKLGPPALSPLCTTAGTPSNVPTQPG